MVPIENSIGYVANIKSSYLSDIPNGNHNKLIFLNTWLVLQVS
jgi:hypothetical protein